MTNTKLRFATYSVLVCLFATIAASSCRKKTETSSIVFTNDAYTPITISVNGSTQQIPVNGSVTYTANVGSVADVNASTSGSTSSGSQVGNTISWSFTDNFPGDGGGVANDPLDVDANYFYLYMVNNSPYATTSLVVNLGLNAQTTDNVTVPNNGNTYGIGYYLAFSNTEVEALLYGGSTWTSNALYIPNTIDATATVTIQ